MFKKLIYILFSLIGFLTYTQNKNDANRLYGTPYINHYSPSDYNFHRQNWSFIQDEKGIIYAGNTEGLLTFDGINWRQYKTPNKTIIRSLGKDENGRIYYGGRNDFGYLDNDNSGNLKFVSLVHNIPKLVNKLEDVWSIRSLEGRVYFQSLNHILSFNPDNINGNLVDIKKDFESTNKKQVIAGLSKINNKIYFWLYSKGLMILENGKIEQTSIESARSLKQIAKIIPSLDDKKMIICTISNGLFSFNGIGVKKIEVSKKLDNLLEQNRIFDIQRLSDNTLVLCTNKSGLIIINEKGRILQKINTSLGLKSNSILNSFIDSQGGLWLATSQGIARVETPSPLEYFSSSSNIQGIIRNFVNHQDNLHIGTKQGVYKILSDSLPTRFKKVANITEDVFSLSSTGETLLAAFPYLGLYEINGDNPKKIIDRQLPVKIKQSRFDSDLFFVGSGSTIYGFAILQKTKKGWKSIYLNPTISDQIREIEEESKGVIWLGTRTNGYLRLEIPDLLGDSVFDKKNNGYKDTLNVFVKRYTIKNNTTSFRSRLYHINNKIQFASSKGLRKIDSTTNYLLLNDNLHSKLADSTIAVNIIRQSLDKSLWIYTSATKNSIAKLEPKNEGYQWKETPELNRTLGTVFTDIFPDPKNANRLFLGSANGIITYNSSIKRPYNTPFSAIVRKVLIEDDSLVYNGNWLKHKKNRNSDTYNFSQKAISFSYASASFDMPQETEYQYALEGYDETWSTWSTKTKKEYTNLPGGDYTFKVRAKNIYEVESSIARFSFSIKPPWYLSFSAYLAYLIGLAISIVFILKYRENKIREKQRIELAKLENKMLKTEIKYKEKDLSDFAINISQNKQWATKIYEKLIEIKGLKGRTKTKYFDLLMREVKDRTIVEESKLDFQNRIDVLNTAFYESLKKNYPDLTPNEIKLCSLIKLNLENHNIAILQNVTIESVYKSRYRLRKKLKIQSDTDLNHFLRNI